MYIIYGPFHPQLHHVHPYEMAPFFGEILWVRQLAGRSLQSVRD